MIETCTLLNFISNGHTIIDVRSENEYLQGHIPGAINLPILNNEVRKAVGTCYKQNGQEAAVTLGFELVGPKFSEFIKEAQKIAHEKELNIYCWRGGMRS
ncbi:MAG TPA: rhodanese-like domain-containing protein, partial [Bacteroidia bacterium]|nr:rhodanese-like domain-containing protein [Bacteroidia bacterium]